MCHSVHVEVKKQLGGILWSPFFLHLFVVPGNQKGYKVWDDKCFICGAISQTPAKQFFYVCVHGAGLHTCQRTTFGSLVSPSIISAGS